MVSSDFLYKQGLEGFYEKKKKKEIRKYLLEKISLNPLAICAEACH